MHIFASTLCSIHEALKLIQFISIHRGLSHYRDCVVVVYGGGGGYQIIVSRAYLLRLQSKPIASLQWSNIRQCHFKNDCLFIFIVLKYK